MSVPTPRPGSDASPVERQRFWVDLALTASLQRPSWVTGGLIAAITAIHLSLGAVMMSRGRVGLWGLLEQQRGARLLTRAGGLAAEQVGDGEPWRLISALFLHVDGLHLLLNAAALYSLGQLCEALFGRARFLWLYLLCGLGGSLATWAGGTKLSVGASGAIFGLMGAAMAYGWRHGDGLPEDIARLLRRRLLPWVGLNLLVGALVPVIDNRAHIGGLVAGLALGATLGDDVTPGREAGPAARLGMVAGSLGLLAWGAWGVWGQWAP